MLGVDERVVETGRRHYQIPESPNGFLIKLRQVIAGGLYAMVPHSIDFFRPIVHGARPRFLTV